MNKKNLEISVRTNLKAGNTGYVNRASKQNNVQHKVFYLQQILLINSQSLSTNIPLYSYIHTHKMVTLILHL